MHTLADVAPEFAMQVEAALSSSERVDLVPQLASSRIERCTHDPSADAAYIYLLRPAPSCHFASLAAPVAETIAFMHEGFNVDVDHDNHLFGIELLGRADVITKLKEARAL